MTDTQIIQWLQDLKQSDTEQQSEIQQLKHLMATLKIFDLNGDNDQQIKELEGWVNIVFSKILYLSILFIVLLNFGMKIQEANIII